MLPCVASLESGGSPHWRVVVQASVMDEKELEMLDKDF